ncbi:MAG: mechanosensitive ion channel domain-containing protein [Sphingobium sp.]
MKEYLTSYLPVWAISVVATLLIAAAALAVALLAHMFLFRVAGRLARKSRNGVDDIFVARFRRPSRWIFVLIVMVISLRAAPLGEEGRGWLVYLSGFIIPVLIGWLALALLQSLSAVIVLNADISTPDNLAARRKRTRIGIISRICTFAIIFLTICMLLLNIPGVRSVGVTLMASAGLAGLAVGAAAQPMLKNLIAGIQMAFSEPIRLDDVVIMDGEWGRIEEIRLTYVVVKIWDERRLVVPVSKFLETSFQNWTRESSQLLGTAFLYVDPTADVPRLRSKLDEVVRAHPKWDQRVIGLQVTDVRPEVMELRALVSAADAGNAFDLRCDVREAMMAFIAAEMPQAMPHGRTIMSGQVETSSSAG